MAQLYVSTSYVAPAAVSTYTAPVAAASYSAPVVSNSGVDTTYGSNGGYVY
ncbi:GH17682 [Drosophila grimshawi]|uniref:GH17682 n=1 Tax=Drosophila grimshawi TaxID=7222 RepID=B4JWV5_DROGR|nr:GH17682 [Drosophila grimshawi]